MTPARIAKESVPVWQSVQTYAFVTVITVLIWLYAESSTLQKNTIYIDIQFVAPTGRELLIDPVRMQRVEVEIRGPTSQLGELNQLRERGPIKLELVDYPDSDDREQKVDLYDRLSAYLAEATPGVTITDIKTADPKVRVEPYQSVTLPIEAVIEADVVLKAPPTVYPAEATLKMPASMIADIDTDTARILARLDKARLADPEMIDQERTWSVRLEPPIDGDGVTITPASVDVTFTITQTSATFLLPTIPVLLTKPLKAEGEYEVIYLGGEDDLPLRNIEIEGPTAVIDQIKKGELKVWAELSLTNDKLAKAIDTDTLGVLTIRTPPGVNVVEQPSSINYKVKLIRKQQAP